MIGFVFGSYELPCTTSVTLSLFQNMAVTIYLMNVVTHPRRTDTKSFLRLFSVHSGLTSGVATLEHLVNLT